MKFRILAWMTVLGVLSGCSLLLPPGDPPEGEIVRNRVSQTLTKPEIIQNLASLLIASSLQDFPRAPVMLEGSDKNVLAYGKAAIKEASSVCGIRRADMAAAILKCEKTSSGAMRFTLYHFSMEKWQRTFYLKENQ